MTETLRLTLPARMRRRCPEYCDSRHLTREAEVKVPKRSLYPSPVVGFKYPSTSFPICSYPLE